MHDVILPVLDEAEALPWVLQRMPAGYRPIVIDNGSSDGSGAIAAAHGAAVLPEPERGFGAACFAGLKAATAAVVCFMDCDATLDPRDLPRVTEPVLSGRAELAIGERRPEPGAWPLHARLSNELLARELGRRTGIRLRDLGPMRAGHRRDLLALEIANRRFGWPLEMVLKAAKRGWRIEQVPVSYRRRTGRSKVTGTIKGTARTIQDMAAVLR